MKTQKDLTCNFLSETKSALGAIAEYDKIKRNIEFDEEISYESAQKITSLS